MSSLILFWSYPRITTIPLDKRLLKIYNKLQIFNTALTGRDARTSSKERTPLG